MHAGIGFGAERVGLAALSYPKLAFACLLALMALIATSLPRVTFDDEINRVFMSDSPLSMAQRAYEQEQSPPLSTVLAHITSQQRFTPSQMTALRNLALDLEFVDGVTAVASPFILRWPPDASTPDGTPLFGTLITEAFMGALDDFDALDTGLPTFMNSARTAMLLTISVDTSAVEVKDAVGDINAEIQRALPTNMTAALTGEEVISVEIVTGLKDELVSLNLWGALVITLAAFALLRDLRMALLAVLPALFGAAGVLALSVWLGYPITVLSNVIPILLLVLGVADGVHLAGHIKDGGTVRDAIAKVGPACALTALTTAAAFASITLSGNAQLFEFAVLGALGTALSFIILISTFALLGSVLPLPPRPMPSITATAAVRLTALGTRRPRLTVALCTLALAISVAGFSQTRSWFPLYQNLPDNSATLTTNDAVTDAFGGVFQMIVEMEGDWTQTRALAEQLEDISTPGSVLSEVNLARWLGHPETRPTPAEMESLPPALVTQLRSKAGTSRIFISVAEPMRSADTLAAYDALYSVAQSAGADRIIGLPTIMRFEAVRLINQLSIGLVVAALGATVLVAAAFRSVRLIPVLIIPNVLPLMLTGASLHLWAKGELSPTAVLALTIAFGIAIDDTVHFLNRFSEAQAQGHSPQDAVRSAAKSAGQVMVLTTLLLTIGLGVTLMSDFTPIRLFGGMMIITLWAALLIDLLLLPALLIRKGSKHVRP